MRPADALASIFRTDGAGSIFDHYQAVAGSDRLNFIDGGRANQSGEPAEWHWFGE